MCSKVDRLVYIVVGIYGLHVDNTALTVLTCALYNNILCVSQTRDVHISSYKLF